MEPVLAGGDPGWIRTIDLPLRRRPLYPLSYEAPVWRCPTRYMRANAPPCKFFECLGEVRGSVFWPTTPPQCPLCPI